LRLEQAGSTPGGTTLWKKIVDGAAEGVAPGKPTKVFIADAGFGCVPMAIYAAKKGIFIIACIKKYHAGFLQARLLKEMETTKSGCWLTMTCTIEGVEVVAVAYK
jgi:hypothetical protein